MSSTSFKGYFDDLALAFFNGWKDAEGKELAPVSWPNVAFSKPSGAPWVRFLVLDGASAYKSIGRPAANIVRHVGQVVIQVFVPVLSAETKARELADAAAEIFHGKNIGGVRFQAAYLTPVSASLDDGWHQVNVTIPFQRDEYK